VIESGGKTPPTYDLPGQSTPGYKKKLDGSNKPKATPKPTPPSGRRANPRGNRRGN